MGRKIRTLCRLGEACRRKGLSVEQAGVLGGLSPDRTYRLSRGESLPTEKERAALAEVLKVDAGVLWPEPKVGSAGAAEVLAKWFGSAEGIVVAGRLLSVLQEVRCDQ